MYLALQTNTYIWQSEFLQNLDVALQREGFGLLQLPWQKYELLVRDTDHFTWRGYCAFSRGLAEVLSSVRVESPVTIYADSTVDYHNYDRAHNFTGRANDQLLRDLQRKGINATVDAVSGSGFSAMRKSRMHFSARAKGNPSNGSVIVIGGWNDATFALEQVVKDVRTFLKVSQQQNISVKSSNE